MITTVATLVLHNFIIFLVKVRYIQCISTYVKDWQSIFAEFKGLKSNHLFLYYLTPIDNFTNLFIVGLIGPIWMDMIP